MYSEVSIVALRASVSELQLIWDSVVTCIHKYIDDPNTEKAYESFKYHNQERLKLLLDLSDPLHFDYPITVAQFQKRLESSAKGSQALSDSEPQEPKYQVADFGPCRCGGYNIAASGPQCLSDVVPCDHKLPC
jgi:hypothetical protein